MRWSGGVWPWSAVWRGVGRHGVWREDVGWSAGRVGGVARVGLVMGAGVVGVLRINWSRRVCVAGRLARR